MSKESEHLSETEMTQKSGYVKMNDLTIFSSSKFNALSWNAKTVYFFLKYNKKCAGRFLSVAEIMKEGKDEGNPRFCSKTMHRHLDACHAIGLLEKKTCFKTQAKLYKAV